LATDEAAKLIPSSEALVGKLKAALGADQLTSSTGRSDGMLTLEHAQKLQERQQKLEESAKTRKKEFVRYCRGAVQELDENVLGVENMWRNIQQTYSLD